MKISSAGNMMEKVSKKKIADHEADGTAVEHFNKTVHKNNNNNKNNGKQIQRFC
jgi:hypothetical protein